ncbi:unnamed protein product [Discula destructiva]
MPYQFSEEMEDAQPPSPGPFPSSDSCSSSSSRTLSDATTPSPSPAPAVKSEQHLATHLPPLFSADPSPNHTREGGNEVRWEVTSLELSGHSPVYNVRVGPMAWRVDDVLERDRGAFDRFCAGFVDWEGFFTSRACPTSGWRYLPPHKLPGVLIDINVVDNMLFDRTWMMLVQAEILVGVHHLGACKELLQAVIAFMRQPPRAYGLDTD